MRRFDYVSYINPDDPKRQRTERYGKIRTEAKHSHDIASEFLADIYDAVLQNVDGVVDSDDRSLNKFQFVYTFAEPFPCSVLVEMQEVAEGKVHPLTQEGFVAWAEDRVKAEPVVDGKSNSVELELAGVLHHRQVEGMYEEKASDLRVWLSDLLWFGQRGYSEMSREELLRELQVDFIDDACESIETVEDVLE